MGSEGWRGRPARAAGPRRVRRARSGRADRPLRSVPLRRGAVGGAGGRLARLRARLAAWRREVGRVDPVAVRGRVTQVLGLVAEADGPVVEVGELLTLERRRGGASEGGGRLLAEAVGFRDRRVLLMPLQGTSGLALGAVVTATGRRLAVGCGEGLLGRVLDGLGRPLDGRAPAPVERWRPAEGEPPSPLERAPIREPLPVGVRAIDALLTCGRGQRLGIFAGSGVGKSTLLGMLCRHTAADVAVVALIGERGREVGEFIEADLGRQALGRSVVVVATSDQPPVVRLKATLVATTIAEHFRDRGAHVLLVMDSLTRYAQAMREVGLASGEPPTSRGYTPSVFAALPRLLERSGCARRGSITGFYTVLVEGDDLNEPVADAVRGLLDGHIVLSRALAERGHFPAIDVLRSVSRLADRLVDGEHAQAARRVRGVLATYQQAEDLVDIGAYRPGTTAAIDTALRWIEPVRAFLRQARDERAPWEESRSGLLALGGPAA